MKILYVTTIGTTMGFFKSLVSDLVNNGHTVDIACNCVDSAIPALYTELGCKAFNLSCSRSPFDKGNIRAIGEIKRILSKNHYDIVHCHTPIAAAITRIAAKKVRKNGTKVIYTAHGFHFYKGAPLKNWLIYYPVEKLCAHFTDILITINKEDYALAKQKLKAKKIEYVPGVGIDTKRFSACVINKAEKRKELGVPENAVLLLSVGELNKNKNHEVVIKALAKLQNTDIYYLIAGKGTLEDYLNELTESLNLKNNVRLLGYRTDIAELYKAADICIFPSVREGLGLAAIEGMAVGLPLIVADNRGTRDFCHNKINGLVCNAFVPNEFANAINELVNNSRLCENIGNKNLEASKLFDIKIINTIMKNIYFNSNKKGEECE